MLRAVADAATARRHPVLRRRRGVDGLRDRGLHDLRAAGRRRGRPHPLLPVLRRGAGVRRRPGALRRRRHACRGTSSAPTRWEWCAVTVTGHGIEATGASTCRHRWARCRSRARCSPRPGCSAFGRELEPFVDLTAIGAVVTKSVQLRPRSGRPTPRMAETPSGMLNSIGLQGPGIDGLLADELPWLAERGVRSLVSIAGTRVEDFAELADAAARRARRARPRGQHQLPERREPRRGVRLRPGGGLRRRRRGAGGRRPGPAGLRQAQPRRHRHRRASPARSPTPAPTGCR